MVESRWIFIAIFVVGAILLRLWRKTIEIKWPPGPSRLPIIGNLHQLFQGGNLLHLTFTKMAEEHGHVMTIWLGGWRPTIVVSGHDQAWEVLVTKSSEYASRTIVPTSKYMSASWRTVATADYGPYWHALRKGIQNSVMNPFNISAQTSIQETDVAEMIHALGSEASQNGDVVKPLMQLKRSATRLMGRLIFGSEFKIDGEFMYRLDSIIHDIHLVNRNSGMANLFPITRHIPGVNRSFREWAKIGRKIEALFCPILSLSEPNTYLHFLKTQNFPDEVTIANLFELFLLSLDSITATTVWALAFLIHNQGVQQKLHDEAMRFSREKGGVNVEDLSSMQYVHAVVKETMRMKPIAPLGIPHMVNQDTTLMGAKIVKGTPVVVNLHQVLNDPKVWEEPEVFMPERFLPGYGGGDDAARVRSMEVSLIPFGAGRRVCAGMELAKLHIALMIANLVSAYHWCGFNGKLPDMTEEFNGILELKTPLVAQIKHRDA